MNELALETDGLNFSFDKIEILKNINFKLQQGEVHAIAGQNGAGKSTLMKIFNGVYRPDSGNIKFFGDKIKNITPRVALNTGIAMVYQELSLVNTLTVAENIFLSHHPFKKFFIIDDKQAIRESEKLLEKIGVNGIIDPMSYVEDLSVGKRQLVEIAKALSHRPRILILDEPTASLSGAETKTLFSAIEKLKNNGISIIYITHYLDDLKQVCDRVSILRDGELVDTLDIPKVSIKKIIRLMLGGDGDIFVKGWQVNKTVQKNKNPILELINVSTDSIDSISLKVYPGEIVGLAGLLGSGRTEILKAIYGLDKIKSGKIIFSGKEIFLKSPREAIKSGISMVPEDRRKQGLVVDFSIEQNLVLQILKALKKILILNKKKAEKISEKYINYLEIKSLSRRQQVRFLSGGNQQKVVIGKCLASNSKLLLLDDPTFGIDIHSKIEIMKLVKEYTLKGNSVIFVSSELKEMTEFCDKTYIVKKSKIEKEFNNIASEEKLLELVQ